jgi:hypothetical protein
VSEAPLVSRGLLAVPFYCLSGTSYVEKAAPPSARDVPPMLPDDGVTPVRWLATAA